MGLGKKIKKRIKKIVPKEVRHAPRDVGRVIRGKEVGKDAAIAVSAAVAASTNQIVENAHIINNDVTEKMDEFIDESVQWRDSMQNLDTTIQSSVNLGYRATALGSVFVGCTAGKYAHQMSLRPNISANFVRLWGGSAIGAVGMGLCGAYLLWNQNSNNFKY
eukprot:78030_1